jgi:hypothetical protein
VHYENRIPPRRSGSTCTPKFTGIGGDFFVLLPFGIYAGGTVIRYELRPEKQAVNVPIQAGANHLDVHGSEEELKMAALAPALSLGCYTWTFPGCPIQIRIRLEIVDALQRLVEQAQDSGTLAPFAGGLLLGDTASPGVTEVAGIAPLAGLDAAAVEAAIGKAERGVVGFFRTLSGDPAQPGASLRMTDDDVTLAAGFFNQPSSVVLLIETVETAAAKATFFFWGGGKMLGDFPFMDFPLDAHQLAALERQRTTPRGGQQPETEINLEAARIRNGSRQCRRDVGTIAVLCLGAVSLAGGLLYSSRRPAGPKHRTTSERARPSLSADSMKSSPSLPVQKSGTEMVLATPAGPPATPVVFTEPKAITGKKTIESASTSARAAPRSSQVLHLEGKRSVIVLGREAGAALELSQHPERLSKLIRRGSLFTVTRGTAIKPLLGNRLGNRFVIKVLIMEGSMVGQEGWTQTSQLSP